MLAEANAAANGTAQPPSAAAATATAPDEDVMEIEQEPEPEQIRIVRDYKRPDPKCAANQIHIPDYFPCFLCASLLWKYWTCRQSTSAWLLQLCCDGIWTLCVSCFLIVMLIHANNLAFRQVRHPSLLDGHCKRGLPLSTIQSRSYQHAAMYNVLHAFGAACVTHDRHAKLQVQDPENPRIP